MILNFLKGFQVNGSRKNTNFEDKIKKGIKLHTIRKDEHKRWKEGMKIHFSTGSRTPQYNNFKTGVCKGIQSIEIRNRNIYIDDRELPLLSDKVEWLAVNDGFDSIEDFWAWFDQYSPFTGRIIHWSDIRY